MTTLAFYQQVLQLLQEQPIVLATVVQVQGSVPREVGAKMIVCGGGQIFFTIGGGAGEAKVIQQALTVLATGEKQWVEIDLSGAPQRETQGICGGMMQVWLERWQGMQAMERVQQMITQLQAGQFVKLITPFSPEHSPYLSSDLSIPANFLTSDAFIEVIQPPPVLLIVGAGHVGEQLAKVADLIGFQVAVQDERSEWANAQRYPQAQIFTARVEVVIDRFSDYNQLYVALVTRGFAYDLLALRQLVKRRTPCAYIGMIGSRKRVRQVRQTLVGEGMAAERLQAIYAPIGLDIGALTPAEIAVSISAELIRVRRGGTGRSLSEDFSGQSKSFS